jgi:hypothetical protein
MTTGDRSFSAGRWYVSFRGFGVSLVSWKDREWGWSEDWYDDGPIYVFGLGLVLFSYIP